MTQELLDDFIGWSFTHGIIMGVPQYSTEAAVQLQPLVTHAPFSLNPYKFPRNAFLKAISLASIFNILVDKVSLDYEWLSNILEFVSLYIYERVRLTMHLDLVIIILDLPRGSFYV